MDEQIKPVVRFVSDLSCGGGGWCVGVMREANSTDEDPDEWYVKYADHQQAIDTLRAEVAEAWAAADSKAGWEWKKRSERAETETEALLKALRVAVLALAHASEADAKYFPTYQVVSAAIDAARKGAE